MKSDVICCISDISFLQEPRAFELYVSRVSAQRAEKARSYNDAQNRARTLGAGLLLDEALRRFFAEQDCCAERAEWAATAEVCAECTTDMAYINSINRAADLEQGAPCTQSIPEQASTAVLLHPRAPLTKQAAGCSICDSVAVRAPCSATKLFLPSVLAVNANGKPYLQNYPEIHISLSHSGDYAACAVSCACAVGVDIERFRAATDGVMRKCCTKHEYESLARAAPTDERNALFCAIWTQKESYIKATGEGLAVPLNTVWVDGSRGAVMRGGEQTPFYCRSYNLDMPYALSLCCSAPVFPRCVERIPLRDVYGTK